MIAIEHRTEKIDFRVTPTELNKIESKVKESNMSRSEFVRNAALNKEIIVIEGLKELSRNLKGISNNLNQALILAYKGHINSIDVEPTQKQVEEIWHSLNLLTGKMKK